MITASGTDWGSVPQWISSFLTGGSLLLGFYILLRDRRSEERRQALQLSAHYVAKLDDGPGQDQGELPFVYRVDLFNGSDSVIVEPMLFGQPRKFRRKERDAQKKRLTEGNQLGSQPQYRDRVGRYVWSNELREVEQSLGSTKAYDEEPGVYQMPPKNADYIQIPLLHDWRLYDWYIYFTDANGRVWRRDLSSMKLKQTKNYGYVKPPKTD